MPSPIRTASGLLRSKAKNDSAQVLQRNVLPASSNIIVQPGNISHCLKVDRLLYLIEAQLQYRPSIGHGDRPSGLPRHHRACMLSNATPLTLSSMCISLSSQVGMFSCNSIFASAAYGEEADALVIRTLILAVRGFTLVLMTLDSCLGQAPASRVPHLSQMNDHTSVSTILMIGWNTDTYLDAGNSRSGIGEKALSLTGLQACSGRASF